MLLHTDMYQVLNSFSDALPGKCEVNFLIVKMQT